MKTHKELVSTVQAVAGFRKDTSGSMTMFSLFMFVAMILIGGIAVDVMRFENVRAKMQNTMDRAVLAAADLDQTEDPKIVVKDYLAKVGIEIDENDVQVVQSGSYPVITGRSVTAETTIPMGTIFMQLMGINELPAPAGSTAEEAINDIEISLILDVSGSMGNPASKLANMQTAAKDFVSEILVGSEPGRVSMSVVPYSTQVSAGETLLNQWNVTSEHTYSSCIDFDSADFSQTSITSSALNPLQRTGHFDPWSSYRNGATPRYRVCRDDADFSIQPWTDDVTSISNQIDGFFASGNTSIDLAVKWGAALLDPSSQSALTGMIAAGEVDATFAGRPYAYDREDTLKFLVVMTDGINTTQYKLRPEYSSGLSGIWKDSSTGRYSTADQEYQDRDGDGDWWEDYWYASGRYWIDNPYGGSNATELTWPQVWNEMSLSYNAYYNFYRQYYDADDYYDNLYGPRTYVSSSTKDAQLDQICDAAKANGVIIFAIGFEVTDYSAGVMENCASTANHFFRVQGLDIEYAFASIANQINQLKLTQ